MLQSIHSKIQSYSNNEGELSPQHIGRFLLPEDSGNGAVFAIWTISGCCMISVKGTVPGPKYRPAFV